MTPELQSAIRTAGPCAVARARVALLASARDALEAGAAANLLLTALAAALQRADTDDDGPVAELVGHAAVVSRRQPGAVTRVLDELAGFAHDQILAALAAELALAATEGERQIAVMAAADLRALDEIVEGRVS